MMVPGELSATVATYLSNQLITKTAVFVGYSLAIRTSGSCGMWFLKRLGRTRRMAYTISLRPSGRYCSF